MEGRGGHWNRAGRRSGGDRPIEMIATPLTPAEEREQYNRWLFGGIAARSPIACIVGYALAAYGDAEVRTAMIRAGVGVPP